MNKELHDAIMDQPCHSSNPAFWKGWNAMRERAAKLVLAAPATEDDTLVRELIEAAKVVCEVFEDRDHGALHRLRVSLARAESQASRGLPEATRLPDDVVKALEHSIAGCHCGGSGEMWVDGSLNSGIRMICAECRPSRAVLAKYAPATPVKETNDAAK